MQKVGELLHNSSVVSAVDLKNQDMIATTTH